MAVKSNTLKFAYWLYLLIIYQIHKDAHILASASNIIKVGSVLSKSGDTVEMTEAYEGYQLLVNHVNNLNEGKGMAVRVKNGTPVYHFKFNFTRKDDESDSEKHEFQVQELLDEGVHFLFGSHPKYAEKENSMTNEAGVYNLHCCVGPDSYYQQNYKYVFGIQTSNERYITLMLKTFSLYEKIKSFAIAYEKSQEFTRTTCKAAYKYANELKKEGKFASVEPYDAYDKTKDDRDEFMKNFAKKVKENEIDVVIGCFFDDEGRKLVNAINDIKYPLKEFFITVGPTKQEWVNSFDDKNRTDNLLSAAQWHKELDLKDDMFGTTDEYIEKYQNEFNKEMDPTYLTAGASAMGYILYKSFQNAFKKCDLSLTNGDIDKLLYDENAIKCDDEDVKMGYDRIKQSLESMDENTFFGRVKFDENQRNMGLEPVTTQVFHKEYGTNYRTEIDAVLPLEISNAVLKIPAKNYYKEDCKKGYYLNGDEFDGCVPCESGKESNEINAEHCQSCDLGYWNDKKGQIKCNECPNGATTTYLGSTSEDNCTCIKGYYNPNGENGKECLICPFGAECNGFNEKPYPKAGYWYDKNYVSEMYKCDPSDICLGGIDAKCKNGYSGSLCAKCEEGYFKLFENCHSCFKKLPTVLMMISIFILWYIINVTVSRNVPSIEMMMDWTQLVNIIGDVKLDWPIRLNTLFSITSILDFDVDILEPSCLVSWSYTHNLIIQLLIPFFMSVMAAFIFLSSYFLHILSALDFNNGNHFPIKFFKWPFKKHENPRHLQEKWDKTIATFLASVEVPYVTICKYCFDAFKCETIADKSVLSTSPDIGCYTKKHNEIRILASLGIFFYVILYTILISWKLYTLNVKDEFCNAIYLRRFGFLYIKFEIEYYYNSIIILVRKLVFVIILVFLDNPAFQAGAMTIVIIASLMFHVYSTPYIDFYLDLLFSFLMIDLLFIAFGGLMFSSNLLSEIDRTILELIVLFTIFILIVVFVSIFILEIRKIYHIRYLKSCLQLENDNNDKKEVNEILQSSLHKVLSPFWFFDTNSYSRHGPENIFELIHTFHPDFLYTAIKKNNKLIEDWPKLTYLLAEYMCVDSETSHLCKAPIAKFWRKLVYKFPELIDFLAVTDDETRKSFRIFAESLYRYFYLPRKVTKLPIYSVLQWTDYGPMAQWLALISNEERKEFLDYMVKLFEASTKKMADTLKKQIETKGNFDHFVDIDFKKLHGIKKRAYEDFKSMKGPLHNTIKEKRSDSLSQNDNAHVINLHNLDVSSPFEITPLPISHQSMDASSSTAKKPLRRFLTSLSYLKNRRSDDILNYEHL